MVTNVARNLNFYQIFTNSSFVSTVVVVVVVVVVVSFTLTSPLGGYAGYHNYSYPSMSIYSGPLHADEFSALSQGLCWPVCLRAPFCGPPDARLRNL